MKNFSRNGFSLLAIFFGIAATLMIFFPAMSFPNSEESFLGFEIAFGVEFVNIGNLASGQVVGNILSMLAYILPLAAIVILMFVKKGTIVSMVLFGIGTVLLFLMPYYTVTTVSILGTINEIDIDWVKSTGLIIAIICSIGGLSVLIVKEWSLSRVA